MVLIVSMVPLTPSGIGVQEGAFYYFLRKLGAAPGEALGVGIILRAKTLLIAVVGWMLWTRLAKYSPSADRAGSAEAVLKVEAL